MKKTEFVSEFEDEENAITKTEWKEKKKNRFIFRA